MTTPITSILFMALAALLGALGQYLYKSGADAADGTLLSYAVNARIVGGVVCYVGVMVLFIAAFRLGGSLTMLYPSTEARSSARPSSRGEFTALQSQYLTSRAC